MVAEAVGTAAIRYADLSTNPQSNVTFTWDSMLSLDGNTAPYLMYSYARCRSIQRKGNIEATLDGCGAKGKFERALALHLLQFGETVASATSVYRPNMLCGYLYDTAEKFNRFYREERVLGAETETDRQRRLALVEATARVLKRGFSLLGITPLERI